VPLNLAVSLVPAILALSVGAGVSPSFGTVVAQRLSKAPMERAILVLLLAIGLALIVESVLPGRSGPAFIP
jgi:hypothetical protein